MPPFEFEWDPRKNQETIQRRGLSFRRAAKIFSGPVVRWVDNRQNYGETRWVAIGRADGRLMTVVYTIRGNKIRIISARKANKNERRKYYDAYLR